MFLRVISLVFSDIFDFQGTLNELASSSGKKDKSLLKENYFIYSPPSEETPTIAFLCLFLACTIFGDSSVR